MTRKSVQLVCSAVGIFLSSFPSGAEYLPLAGQYKTSQFHWSRGLIFGAVILMWHARVMRDFIKWRSGMFLIVSTLIYGWLIWISNDRLLDLDLDVWWIGLVGITVILPAAQALFLKTRWKRMAYVSLGVLISWLLLWGTATGCNYFVRGSEFFYNTMSLWQILYLFFMFGPVFGNRGLST